MHKKLVLKVYAHGNHEKKNQIHIYRNQELQPDIRCFLKNQILKDLLNATVSLASPNHFDH